MVHLIYSRHVCVRAYLAVVSHPMIPILCDMEHLLLATISLSLSLSLVCSPVRTFTWSVLQPFSINAVKLLSKLHNTHAAAQRWYSTHTHTERLINEHLNAHLTSRNSLYSPACPWHCGGSTWVNGYASIVFIRYSLYDNISIYFATRITFISPYAQRCTGSISTE